MVVKDDSLAPAIAQLIDSAGIDSKTYTGQLVAQLIETSLKLPKEGNDLGQLKLITRSFKEIRHAYRIFNQYRSSKFLSIFGSARTPEDHPDYMAAKEFSKMMAGYGWMCITGAANGIMKAGHEGTTKESIFGLSIKLPFEITINNLIDGDPKHIAFRYFFTRKLMFLSHSHAVAAYPGGFGTLDELFEVLTLMQTGKSSIIPIVLMEGEGGSYWETWNEYMQNHLLGNGWISPEDRHFYFHAKTPLDGLAHIEQFYKRYHSSRYVKDKLVLRLKSPLTQEQVETLNDRFAILVLEGKMEQCAALEEEDDVLELPRLVFTHTRKNLGLVRALIDAINLYT